MSVELENHVLAGDTNGAVNLFAGTEGIYLLPHHAKEIERLRKQHAFILSSTGGALVTAPLKQFRVKVLDSGAADGTWLLDLPRLYPQHEWSLHGVDIGSAIFPPRVGPYASLDLREFDIRSSAPPDPSWEQSFDLVHQRLLIWGLQTPEWSRVVKNHYSMLKPGGWIQLVEGQWVDRDRPFDPEKYPSLAKMSEMQKWSTSNFGMDIYVAYRLENLLKEAGFERVEKTHFNLGYGALAREVDWKQRSADMWIDTFRSLGSKLPEGGIPGVARDVDEFHEFLSKLHSEVLEYGYQPRLNYVVGQKPE